ncbi:MAG: biosynthetic-type acetolactate synthase large subunit [Deltaproteobacteria bacterium]|jgi:acetolactate synthase-1/2/3 large subunit|nr:biosynthetic-type acetolactate synthase large subunit [Deltaproteobacteria bacterium]
MGPDDKNKDKAPRAKAADKAAAPKAGKAAAVKAAASKAASAVASKAASAVKAIKASRAAKGPAKAEDILNGAQAIVRFLKERGTPLVFGYPGGAVIPLYDALYDSGLRHILARHEQGAIHAADGFARATGKTGVVFATSGPGATNLVTGLATAHMDSVPLVAITGQVPTTSLGSDSFQEADIYGISIPITKYNYLIKDPADLLPALSEAFHIASTGRPGPVLVDIPKDVQTAALSYFPPKTVPIPGYSPSPKPDPEGVAKLAEAIAVSRRPLLYVGGGAITTGVQADLLKLAEGSDMAVVTSLQAKGAFPDTHPLCLGLPGMHGPKYANIAINEADLIVGLGARFDDRVVGDVRRFAPLARVAHVDVDPAEIGKRVPADLPVEGDLRLALELLLATISPERKPEWRARILDLKAKHPLAVPKAGKDIRPQAAIKALSDKAGDGALFVTDVGQHQMWCAQFLSVSKPRRFLSSGGLGTMGFGLPAAMGAALGHKGGQVYAVVGDGGFQMTLQELATVRQYGIPVKILIINNGCLGMVRQWQEFFNGRRYSETVFGYNPDFAKLAAVYGIPSRRVDKPQDLDGAVSWLVAEKGPALLDAMVAKGENVLPMIPAGKGQTDFYETEG